MKAKKFLFALGLMLAVGTFTACTNDSTSEDELYEHGIDKKEIENEDT